jgi:effector-binding domain-containing protein
MCYPIKQAHSEAIHTAVVRSRVRPPELSQFVPTACGEVWSFIRSAGLPRPGRHVALYLDTQGTLEVGAEVSEPFVGNDRVQCSQLPSGRVATTVHFGPYARLSEAHTEIRQWCAERGHHLSDVPWEMFWNGQSFGEPALEAAGKFKAAQIQFSDQAEIDVRLLRRWLRKASTDICDYRGLIKARRADA